MCEDNENIWTKHHLKHLTRQFHRAYMTLTVVGFFIMGALQLQIIEFEYRYGERNVALAKRSGEKVRELEATRLGLGRYEGSTFVWSTNIFNSLDLAITSVLESEKRSREFSDVCLRMAKITLETGEVITKFERRNHASADSTKIAQEVKD